MITNPPLYTATGGPKSHSIRRKKNPPLMRQKTLPESSTSSNTNTSLGSPCKRPAVTRQRSLSSSRMKSEEEELHISAVSGRLKQRNLSQSYSDIVTTNRRLVLALDQFTSTALPFYLELITRYTNKIQKLRATDDKCEEEKRAVEQAGKAVRQLGSLLFEMEVLRSFLETEAELRYFDNRVSPGKVLAHRVVNNLKALCPEEAYRLELTSTRCIFSKLAEKQVRRFSETGLSQKQNIEKSHKRESVSLNDISYGGQPSQQETKQELLMKKSVERKKELRFDEVIHDLQSDALRICSEKQKTSEGSTAETWKILEEEISDVKLLIETYHEKSRSGRGEKQQTNPPHQIQQTYTSVQVPSSSSSSSTSRIYPMAGAVLGSCIGAPVAILAGIKIGGLATLSGIIFGYSTGSIVKKFAQQQEHIATVYNEIAPQDRSRIRNFDLQAKRAVSLPDMLNDDKAGDDKNTIGAARKIWMKQSQAKSSENLLL